VSSPGLVLRSTEGAVVTGHRWTGTVDHVDDAVLRRCRPPVLDVGCGPGRHVLALAEQGVPALGIDLTPHVVTRARQRGALVLERCIFERVPGVGRWGTVLLLDGNIGIGADPAGLLHRVAGLVKRDGTILVEIGAPIAGRDPTHARLEHEGIAGPWFPWCGVEATAVTEHGAAAGLHLHDRWRVGEREFLELRPSPPPWR
jgi:SAM-dependent methyltransferase